MSAVRCGSTCAAAYVGHFWGLHVRFCLLHDYSAPFAKVVATVMRYDVLFGPTFFFSFFSLGALALHRCV